MGKILLFIFNEMTDYEVTFITHLLGVDGGKEIISIFSNSVKGLKF